MSTHELKKSEGAHEDHIFAEDIKDLRGKLIKREISPDDFRTTKEALDAINAAEDKMAALKEALDAKKISPALFESLKAKLESRTSAPAGTGPETETTIKTLDERFMELVFEAKDAAENELLTAAFEAGKRVDWDEAHRIYEGAETDEKKERINSAWRIGREILNANRVRASETGGGTEDENAKKVEAPKPVESKETVLRTSSVERIIKNATQQFQISPEELEAISKIEWSVEDKEKLTRLLRFAENTRAKLREIIPRESESGSWTNAEYVFELSLALTKRLRGAYKTLELPPQHQERVIQEIKSTGTVER